MLGPENIMAIEQLSKWLGHASTIVTARHYSHANSDWHTNSHAVYMNALKKIDPKPGKVLDDEDRVTVSVRSDTAGTTVQWWVLIRIFWCLRLVTTSVHLATSAIRSDRIHRLDGSGRGVEIPMLTKNKKAG